MPSPQANLISESEDRLGSLKFQVKQLIKKITSPYIRKNLRRLRAFLNQQTPILIFGLISNYAYDFKKFWLFSSANRKVETQTQLRALITMDYHRLEKGLALKQPRVGFGEEVIQRLLSNLPKYQAKYGFDETVQIAINTLFAYYDFNVEYGLKNDSLYKTITEINNKISCDSNTNNQGGFIEVTKQSILTSAQLDLQEFFLSRYSVRHFTSEEVDISLIERAVGMAQKTPSVCNRQSSKIYVFSSDADKRKVLGYQNGNRGFSEQISKVLIVVSDLENFTSIGERNQCWIDGGMYAMSLIYALHSLGLGTCCLNWSVERKVDLALKKVTGIRDSESVMMMIAVGQIPEKLKVAQSPRKKVQEVLIVK